MSIYNAYNKKVIKNKIQGDEKEWRWGALDENDDLYKLLEGIYTSQSRKEKSFQRRLNRAYKYYIIPFYKEHKTDKAGRNLLHWAVFCRQSEKTILSLIYKKNINVIKSLFHKKINTINVNGLDDNKETPLHYAEKIDYLTAVKHLIRKNANQMTSKDIHGNTPLVIAAKNNATEVVRYFLKNKKKRKIISSTGFSEAFIGAIQSNNVILAFDLWKKKSPRSKESNAYEQYNILETLGKIGSYYATISNQNLKKFSFLSEPWHTRCNQFSEEKKVDAVLRGIWK